MADTIAIYLVVINVLLWPTLLYYLCNVYGSNILIGGFDPPYFTSYVCGMESTYWEVTAY